MRSSKVAPLLAPLSDLGPLPARRAGAAAPQPWVEAPQRRALLVEGWDDEAEGSGGHLGGYHPRRLRPVPPAGRQAPRPAHGHARGGGRGAGLHPTGVCRVVRGAASPGSTATAPTAPPRRGRRPRSGVARDPRARGGVAAAPRGAGRVQNALTQVCSHWAGLPVRPPKPLPPPPPSYLSAPAPPRPRPPPAARQAGERGGRGHRPPPQGGGSVHPPPRPNGDGARRPCPPSLPPPPHPPPRPPPRPTRGTVAGGGAQHAWSADMHSRRDSHRAPPGRPVSLKIGLQIKSNQIPPPAP